MQKSWSDRLDDLLRESQLVRDLYEPTWDENLNWYLGNHWKKPPKRGLKQFVDNRIQAAIIAHAAVQTESRPRIKLTPVETSDPPVTYLSPSGAAKVSQLNLPDITPQQLQGQVPLSLEQASLLMMQAGPDDPATGQPTNVFGPEDFILVNDALAAEALQTTLDVLLDRSDFDYNLVENVLNKGVVGHQDMLCQWNESKRVPELVHIHQKCAWCDSKALSGDVSMFEYYILAEVLSEDEAIVRFPEQEEYIRSRATEGPPVDREQMAVRRLGLNFDQDFRRRMVVLWTIWKRNEPIPAAPEDAPELIQAGVVPGSPEWPAKVGLAQVQLIGEVEVFNGECPYSDIPVSRNINLPIPHRPYGIGDPERLADLNDEINRILSIAHNHYKYFQSPQQYMTQSMSNALGDRRENLHSHPGRNVVVPDDVLIAAGGKLKFTEDPPTFSPATISLLQLLISEFQEVSGHTNAISGTPSSGAESGRAILALQQAARGVVGFKAMYTERFVVHLIRLYVDMVTRFMTDEDWSAINSKYPVAVANALRQRTKQLEYDVRVEVVSGRGTSREVELQKARELYQIAPSQPTLEMLLERHEVSDPKALAAQIIQSMGAASAVASGDKGANIDETGSQRGGSGSRSDLSSP
jgi:hypothetical protein